MDYLKAFLIGGLFCAIGQILIDKTKLTPARILVSFVVAGVVLTAAGVYKPLVDWAGAGATIPLTGFGYALAAGVKEAVARDGWIADVSDPSNLLNLFTSYSGNNSTFYNNPEFDRLMGIAAESSDQNVRMEALHAAERLAFTEEWATIPLMHYATQMAISPKLQGATFYPTGERLFFLAYMEE